MDEFKKNIKSMYEKQVDPVFEEKHWANFLAFRNAQKRRNRKSWIIPFVFLFLFVVGLFTISGLFDVSDLKGSSGKSKSADNELIAIEKEDASEEKFKSGDVESAILLSNETEQEMMAQTAENLITGESLDKTIVKESYSHTASVEKVLKENDKASSFAEYEITEDFNAHEEHIANVEEDQKSNTFANVRSYIVPLDRIELSPNYFFNSEDRKFDLPNSLFPIKVFKRNILPKWAVQGFAGVSFPSHVETSDEQSYQFGSGLHYYLNRRWRARLNLAFSNINFVSMTMNPRIGVRSIDAPREEVQFDQAVVESFNLNAEFGLDMILFSDHQWNPYIGIGYGLSKELVKDIDYEFQGEEVMDVISISNTNKSFIPHILTFESGLSHLTSFGQAHISLRYPVQLQKNKIEMLKQVQLTFGISKVF